MSISPKIRCKFGEPIGAEIFFFFPEISSNERSFLDADSAAAIGVLSANGVNFVANDYLVLGQPGYEKTEIVKVASATSTSITLSGTTSFPHNRGEAIQLIPYNQIVPERSTDGGSNFTPLTAINIRPDASETYLQRSSDASTDVYRFRFYNSTTTLYSGYSDNATASGYADNAVYSLFKRALNQMGESWSDLINREFMIDSLDEARRIVDQDPRVFRWSYRTKFNTDIGNIVPGAWSVTVPTDLRDKNTNKNILGLRLGRQNRVVMYQDRNRFNQNYLNIAHSTLNGAITTGSTSIVLTSSGDFDASGSITIGAETVLLTKDAVAYTANDVSTNTLSGVTGITSAGHASGRDVWQGANFGLPTYYTIDNGVIYFDVPFDDAFAGENIYMDYYQAMTAVDSDSDLLDEPFYDMYVPFLKYKIKYKKSNGSIDAKADTDYKEFMDRVGQLISQELSGQNVYFIPNINGFNGLRGFGLPF